MKNKPWPIEKVLLIGLGVLAVLLLAILSLQLRGIWLPALLATAIVAGARPFLLAWLFRRAGEPADFAREMGFRLGQASEFALIIAVVATQGKHLSTEMASLVKLATVLSMLVSSYLVVLKYPTPIGVQPGLQRD